MSRNPDQNNEYRYSGHNNGNVVFKLNEAIRLISHYSGENDIYQFINACDLAVNPIEKINAPLLVCYITTKSSDKKLEIIKYKDSFK